MSEELEEIQWPHRLNLAVLPQFDDESDPEEFLLKYEATIEAAGGGIACKAKALVLALRGLAQRWYANIPPRSIIMEPASFPVALKFSSRQARRSHILRLPKLEARKHDFIGVPSEFDKASRKRARHHRPEHY